MMMGDIDIKALKALQKWNKIPREFQQKIINNVFCRACMNTTIVDYEISYDKFGILLKGKCQKCGNNVARLVEDE